MIVSMKDALAEMGPNDRHRAKMMHSSICQIFSMSGGAPNESAWEQITQLMERWIRDSDMPERKAGWLARSVLKDVSAEY